MSPEPQIHITQPNRMQAGARILAAGAIATAGLAAARLALSPGRQRQDLHTALHTLNLAATMGIAAVILHCHRGTQNVVTTHDEQLEDRIHHVEEVEERILDAAVGGLTGRGHLRSL